MKKSPQINVIKCPRRGLVESVREGESTEKIMENPSSAIKTALGPSAKRLQKMPKSSNTNELSFIRIMYDVVPEEFA